MVFRCTQIRQTHIFLNTSRRIPGNWARHYDEHPHGDPERSMEKQKILSPTTSPRNTTRKVCKSFSQKEPCQLLPLKKKRNLCPWQWPRCLYSHCTEGGKNCIPKSKRNNFLVQDRREWHRQVLNGGKINRFPTTSTLDLPLLLGTPLHFHIWFPTQCNEWEPVG